MKQYLVISMYGMSLYDEEMQVHDVVLRTSEEISTKVAMEYVTYYSHNKRPRWAVMAINVLEGKVVFSKAHNPPAKKRTTLNEKSKSSAGRVSNKELANFIMNKALDPDEAIQQPPPLPEHLNPLYWANVPVAQANNGGNIQAQNPFAFPHPHPENEW